MVAWSYLIESLNDLSDRFEHLAREERNGIKNEFTRGRASAFEHAASLLRNSRVYHYGVNLDASEIRIQTSWRPMETAPLDGREVILKVKMRAGIPYCHVVGHHMSGGYCIEDHPAIDKGWYFWNGCMFDLASDPVAWMPLPDKNGEPIFPPKPNDQKKDLSYYVLELAEAIDNAAADIGGSRPQLDILRDAVRLASKR